MIASMLLVLGTTVKTLLICGSNENSSAIVSPSSPTPPVNGRIARRGRDWAERVTGSKIIAVNTINNNFFMT
jgi:hypothetical protein